MLKNYKIYNNENCSCGYRRINFIGNRQEN